MLLHFVHKISIFDFAFAYSWCNYTTKYSEYHWRNIIDDVSVTELHTVRALVTERCESFLNTGTLTIGKVRVHCKTAVSADGTRGAESGHAGTYAVLG